jgi:hypothetical protein
VKKLLLPFLFLLIPSLSWGTTYTIGPAQDHTTFTNLVANHTLAGGDIVDGGGNTFTETWVINGSGTAGNVITLRNATINAQNTRNNCIDSQGTDYITLYNLTLQNSVAMAISTLWDSTNWTINSCTFTNIGTYGVQFNNGSNNGVVSNCTFTDWGLVNAQQYAVQVIANGATETGPVDVTGCTFTLTQGANTTECAPVMSDEGGWVRTFSNNIVNGGGYLYGAGVVIWRPASIATTITIHSNTISNVRSSGIMLQELEDNGATPTVSIKYNRLTNTCLGDTLDTEALRLRSFTSASNVTVAYNIINGTYDGTNAHAGIRAKGADAAKIYNNTVYGCDDGIEVLAEGADASIGIDIRNNISTGNRGYGLNLEPGSTITGGGGWGPNAWYDNDSGNLSGKAAGAGDVTTDPLFVNAAGGNFRLQVTSPCRDTGTNLGLTRDYAGTVVPQGSGVDMGAYEYGVSNLTGVTIVGGTVK